MNAYMQCMGPLTSSPNAYLGFKPQIYISVRKLVLVRIMLLMKSLLWALQNFNIEVAVFNAVWNTAFRMKMVSKAFDHVSAFQQTNISIVLIPPYWKFDFHLLLVLQESNYSIKNTTIRNYKRFKKVLVKYFQVVF